MFLILTLPLTTVCTGYVAETILIFMHRLRVFVFLRELDAILFSAQQYTRLPVVYITNLNVRLTQIIIYIYDTSEKEHKHTSLNVKLL